MQITSTLQLRRELRRIRRGMAARTYCRLLLADLRRRTTVPDSLVDDLVEVGLSRVAYALRELHREIDAEAERLCRDES
jgi:hypothetical protein